MTRFSANRIATLQHDTRLRFDGKDIPDLNMNATELIQYNGFNPEVHHVTTQDGFILGFSLKLTPFVVRSEVFAEYGRFCPYKNLKCCLVGNGGQHRLCRIGPEQITFRNLDTFFSDKLFR